MGGHAVATDDLEANRPALHDLFTADPYAGKIGARLVDWGGGWSKVELTVDVDQLNFAGWLHGGIVFGLGDAAFAVASNSWGRLSVALSVDVQLLSTATPGDVLTAEARERHRSRRTGAYLIEVARDGRLVGSLHGLVHRTDQWLLGEEAWSWQWRAEH